MAGDTKYCPKCGAPHPLEVLFCTSCGAKFPERTVAQAVAPAASQSVSIPQIPQAARSDFITLSCPNCGGKLQITSDIERFACQYCGHEHLVRRDAGAVSLEPVMQMMGQINNSMGMVGTGVHQLSNTAGRQASEVAIMRLKEEIVAAKVKIETDGKNTSSIWWLVPGFAVAGLVVNFIFSIMPDVGYNMDFLITFVKWIFIVGTVAIFIAAISSSSYYKKDIAKQNDLIRQKEAELRTHYQVVSNSTMVR
jgi:hypothetical protein